MSVRVQRLPVLFWLGAAVYVVLTVLVATHVLDSLDRHVFDVASHHRHRRLYQAAEHLTNVLSPAVDTAVLAVGAATLAWRRRRPAFFIVAALSAGTMAAIVLSTKAALGRSLPYTKPGHDADAFPSGHTATFLVCFGALALLATTRRRGRRRALLTVVGIGTALVAASLVYDGFHWLTDTVASASLGIGLLSLLHSGLRRRTASPSSGADIRPNGQSVRRR